MDLNGIEIEIREPAPGDINFLLSTMLKGLYFGSRFYAPIDQECFFSAYEPFIKQLMLKSTIKVACLADDKDVILGYSIFRSECVSFVFVKKSYRKLGLARMLYPPGMVFCDHITDSGDVLRKKLNLRFNPFYREGN